MIDYHNNFDEKEILEMKKRVEELNEKYDEVDLKFKEPLAIFSPIKIKYKGKKIGIFARDVFGSIRIKKKDGEYVIKNDSVYDLRAPFKKDTLLYELSKKDQDLARIDEDNKDYLKNEATILVMEDIIQEKKPEIEEYIKNLLEPLGN